MSRYVFKKLSDSDRLYGSSDSTEVKVTTEQESLPELLETFKNFLSACGFVIPVGTELELVEEESYEEDSDDHECCGGSIELRDDIQTEAPFRGRATNCS